MGAGAETVALRVLCVCERRRERRSIPGRPQRKPLLISHRRVAPIGAPCRATGSEGGARHHLRDQRRVWRRNAQPGERFQRHLPSGLALSAAPACRTAARVADQTLVVDLRCAVRSYRAHS